MNSRSRKKRNKKRHEKKRKDTKKRNKKETRGEKKYYFTCSSEQMTNELNVTSWVKFSKVRLHKKIY
jgi:hypothetical protein